MNWRQDFPEIHRDEVVGKRREFLIKQHLEWLLNNDKIEISFERAPIAEWLKRHKTNRLPR